MTEPLFETGVAAGMTKVPKSTIRRYVNLFGKYFSPGAQIERGRRFNSKDIELIIAIRRMTNDGFDVAAIELVLSDGWDSKQIPQKETSDAIAVLQKANSDLQEVREEAIKLRKERFEIQEAMNQLVEAHNILVGNNKNLRVEVDYLFKFIEWMRLPFWKRWSGESPDINYQNKVVTNLEETSMG